MKKICLMLTCFAFATPLYADSPYVIGQLGCYNEKDWQSFKYTGRIAVGYEWDTALVLGKSSSELSFLCFNYGFELGYQPYQTYNLSHSETERRMTYYWNSKIERQTIDLLGVLDLAPNCVFDIFIKFGAGVIKHKQENTYEQVPKYGDPFKYSDPNKHIRIVPKIMVGLGFNVLKNINLNIAYTNEFKTTTIKSSPSSPLKKTSSPISLAPPASSIMGGVKFNFG